MYAAAAAAAAALQPHTLITRTSFPIKGIYARADNSAVVECNRRVILTRSDSSAAVKYVRHNFFFPAIFFLALPTVCVGGTKETDCVSQCGRPSF